MLETSAFKLFSVAKFTLLTQLTILTYPVILSLRSSTTVSLETYSPYSWINNCIRDTQWITKWTIRDKYFPTLLFTRLHIIWYTSNGLVWVFSCFRSSAFPFSVSYSQPNIQCPDLCSKCDLPWSLNVISRMEVWTDGTDYLVMTLKPKFYWLGKQSDFTLI